jgi:hypothetical protein
MASGSSIAGDVVRIETTVMPIEALDLISEATMLLGRSYEERVNCDLRRIGKDLRAYHPSELPERLKDAVRDARMAPEHDHLDALMPNTEEGE